MARFDLSGGKEKSSIDTNNGETNQDELSQLRQIAGRFDDTTMPKVTKAYPNITSKDELQDFCDGVKLKVLARKHLKVLTEILNSSEGEEDEDSDAKSDGEAKGEDESDGEEGANGEGESKDGEGEDEDEGEGEVDEGDGEDSYQGEDGSVEDRLVALEKWRKFKIDPLVDGSIREETPSIPSIPSLPKASGQEDFSVLGLALKAMSKKKEEKKDENYIRPDEWGKVESLLNQNVPVLLVGPAGCGKTTLAEMIANDRKVPFGMVSCSGGLTTMDLVGSLMPTGAGGNFEFVQSTLVRMCTRPGVFLIDEIDAADENLMLSLNSMIANRYISINTLSIQTLPSFKQKQIFQEVETTFGAETIKEKIGSEHIRSVSDLYRVVGDEIFSSIEEQISTIRLHPEFRVIAAANTLGHGSDRVYVGRNQLDAATLDRFKAGQVPMDYSLAVEKAILDTDVLLWGYALREALNELGEVKRFVSTRFLKDLNKMKKENWGVNEFNRQFFIGMKEDLQTRIANLTAKKLADIIRNGGL